MHMLRALDYPLIPKILALITSNLIIHRSRHRHLLAVLLLLWVLRIEVVVVLLRLLNLHLLQNVDVVLGRI